MKGWWAGTIAALALVLVVGVAAGTALIGSERASTDVTITIRYSAFEPASVTVPSGVPVRFVLVNDDPIDHEWIVGDADLHERHRDGTEPVHDLRPTEVTVPALTTRETTIVFDEPGRYAVICHLPRHEAYGMVGEVRVVGS
jgi:uncharacterized cupredoxin-like copper-binding protein